MKKQRVEMTPEQDALTHIVDCRDKPFLEERFIDSFKGRGVFTRKTIEPSTFVVEFRGKISRKDTKSKCGDTLNNYVFEFSWIGTQWCIDASKEDRSLGRLVNDDHISPNCEMKKIMCEGKPHLCLFAMTEISPGEEITYNYGDSAYPWRSGASHEGSSTSCLPLYASSSTPRNEQLEDSSASSSESSCSDADCDDEDDDNPPDSGPSRHSDSFADINTQLDLGDSSPFADLDYSQETGTCMTQPNDASGIQQEGETSSSPGQPSLDGDSNPGTPKEKPNVNYCYVCGKGVVKIFRHLSKHAAEEPEIAKAFALPITSKERKKLIDELRKRGNYKHNQEVLKNNSGKLKLSRRPQMGEISAKTCMHCIHCKGMYLRKDLWRHVARCPLRKTANSAEGGKTKVISEMTLAESPYSKNLPSDVQKLLINMRPDEVTFAVHNDFLLIQLAQYLSKEVGNDPSKHDVIRQKLREMGRLLLALYEKSIFSFEDATKPKNFPKVVEAIKDLAGFDEKTQSYKKTTLVERIGYSLKKICNIVLKGVNGKEQMSDTETFMELYVKEWSKLISETTLAVQKRKKLDSPATIPFTRDVQVFYKYLETTSASGMDSLKKYESPQVYSSLCRVTLAQASVLSKCAADVSKMTLKTFQERDISTQVLSKHFIRINIHCKSGQNVAVLLTSELVSAIKLLVSKREACGVHKDNPFLFAKPDSFPTSFFQGANCIRVFSDRSRANNPEYLRSVDLQKHVARIFQILNLENDELSHLAKLLGHDIRTDRDYYRLPEAALELAKIAKLLRATEKGSLEKFKGNSLDEIEVEDELNPDEEQVNPKGSDDEEEEEEDDEESDPSPQQSDAAEQQDSQLTPEEDALQHIKTCRDKPFLKEKSIDLVKGKGVFTKKAIEPSAFVVEYRGNIFSRKETRKKKRGDTLNKYVFDFSWNGTNWRIDASEDDGTLGRLVNDDHERPNCEMKKIVFEEKPHLCLFAVKKICAGEEITFNYGDASYPWRSKKSNKGRDTSQSDQNDAASSAEDESDEDLGGPSSSEASCCDEDYKPPTGKDEEPDDASSGRQEDDIEDASDNVTSDEEFKGTSYTKRNYCFVCGNAQSKISRHLLTHRNEDPDIAEVLKLRKNSKERKALLEKLRDRGNYKHNQEVWQKRSGALKVNRRYAKEPTNAKTFAPCLFCKGMYHRKAMWQHLKKCDAKKRAQPSSESKTKVLTLVAVAESTDPENMSSEVMELLNALKKDDISSEVLNDALLLQLAQYLSHKSERKKKRVVGIKGQLREMGRLLLILKKKSISSFEEAIKLENFSTLAEAVRELSGFTEETKSCGRLSLKRKLGNSLKRIGEINLARVVKEGAERERIHEAERFIELCQKEWANTASEVNTLQTLPFIHDVQRFYRCMEQTATSAAKSLAMYASSPVYNALLQVTFAQLTVFNKNMVEVSKVTLKSFKERDETELQKDPDESQSQLEQILSKDIVTINVMSDDRKKVALTLTSNVLSALTLLVDKREACGVHENNPFLFAKPDASSTGYLQRNRCCAMFTTRAGVKNVQNLRSALFQKHVVRLFQILNLTKDDLEQLAKVLGPSIKTNRDYYLTPEAAGSIAKILELLIATEKGSLERFEGKSLEEIEISGELEPDVEPDEPENSDKEESESSHLSEKGSSSAKKKLDRVSLPKRKRGRPKKQKTENEPSEVNEEKDDQSEEEPESCDVKTPKRRASRKIEDTTRMSFSDDDEDMNVDFDMDIDTDDDVRNEESEREPPKLNDERNEEMNAEKDDRSEKFPASCSVKKPTETLSHKNDVTTRMSFSDDDEDMNVDFDIDIDTDDDDDVRNEENDEGGDTNVSPPLMPHVKKQADKHTSEKTMDIDAENHVETEDQNKRRQKNNRRDADGRNSSDIVNAEKKIKQSAEVPRMKEVKILITKLDIEKFGHPVHISQVPSECKSVKSVEDPPPQNTNQHQTSSSSTDAKEKPRDAKETLMNCSHCKKSMVKGHTAYQKKGFTDVFCSRDCLFQMFPINKPVAKTCHHCLKAISQPLDLIMAAVDIKGTMKDFCSPTCLLSFKSISVSNRTPQQQSCSMCNKSCKTTYMWSLNKAVVTFCSDSCFKDFRRHSSVCENCSYTSLKSLKLKLKEETKSICSQNCLRMFKEKIRKHQQCAMCQVSRPVSKMIDCETEENVVKLFCHRNCVTSYKLQPACVWVPQEETSSDWSKKGGRGKQSKQVLNAVEVKTMTDFTADRNEAAAVSDTTPSLIIADSRSSVVCCNCAKTLQKGETVYKLKNSREFFCSAECLSEREPDIKIVTKTCYNCLQVITRPHNIILAPVDDSGTVKELCSSTCLASVNSKRSMAAPKPPPPVGPRSECRMCSKFCNCKFKVTLDGVPHRICSDACYITYHRINNLPVFICDVCGSISPDKRFNLGTEEDCKIICSEECLVKFKEEIDSPLLCPMCQTPHQLSDMVENKNEQGKLDFFCSNRCMMVHKAQSSTVAGKYGPSPEERDIDDVKPSLKEECEIKEVKPSLEDGDIKELKPLLPYLDCIKEEPMDEGYSPNFSSSISTDGIKDEPKAGDDVTKEDLRIGSVFSLTDSSTCSSPAPTLAHMDSPASCSNCKQVLVDGKTVYQRKGHADIFCSSPCLLKFYQMKKVKKTCHFCLQLIGQPQSVLQAPVDDTGTKKDFCSQACLSSFNYKRSMSTKMPIVPVPSQSQCSMCSRYCISKHEIIQQDVVHKICSDPCFLRFCNMNNLSICENCHSRCNTPLMLRMENGSKKLCNAECLAQFKQKIETPQPCAMCRTPHLLSDMLENKNSENEVELFCTSSCVMASKIQAISASGTPLSCDRCGKTMLPACHLAMSDASIRNFCTLACAMSFKESQKDRNANSSGAADKTRFDYLKPPEKLPCAQCRRIIKAPPKVIQEKGKMNFVCNWDCLQEFKKVNNIMGKCEYCKNEKIIGDVKKVDGKDCYFCSEGCLTLFRHELEDKWSEYCGSCAYCFSISKKVVTAKYEAIEEEFCSEECSSNYNKLVCSVASCDLCGRNGKLRQRFPMLGEVKHFCDLRCLLHFCNKKVQMVNTDSSPPRPSGTVESSPVIANVISLADALARRSRSSESPAQSVSATEIQTKVVGHASIQTVPIELKNKSMLCTPLVHNKGVSCTTKTVDSEAQTDNCGPSVLPIPVPVYVPLPMNMYSQYTPTPVGLPLPLPVPVFLSDPTGKSKDETIQPDLLEEESERKKTQDERNEREDRVVTEEGQRQETHPSKDHSGNCGEDLESDHQDTFIRREDSSSDNSGGSLSRQHNHKKRPRVLEADTTRDTQPELPPPPPPPPPPPAPPAPLERGGNPQSSPSPESASPLSQTERKVHNKNKGRKLHQSSKTAKGETSHRRSSKVSYRKHRKLRSQTGIDAWKRWIQWRESQNDLDSVSSLAVTLKEDVVRCSAVELSNNLCCFITEVKRPDGAPYSPHSLFYLCLSIQQHLFDNGRMENIFSDVIYEKFSTKFTKILKAFKPKITASGRIHSRVEEELLWECKQLGAYSPIVLLSTLLFFCCKYLGFTTVEQHRRLSFALIRRRTRTNENNTKTKFLRFYPTTPANTAESDADGVPAKKRKRSESKEGSVEMMENTENPLRCPVRLYEFYLSKCSESVRRRTDLFYLRPDRSCVPNSPRWFSSSPLDSSTMEALLVRILAVRDLRGGDRRAEEQQATGDTRFTPEEQDSE